MRQNKLNAVEIKKFVKFFSQIGSRDLYELLLGGYLLRQNFEFLISPIQRHNISKISLVIEKLLKFNTKLVFRVYKYPKISPEDKILAIDKMRQRKLMFVIQSY